MMTYILFGSSYKREFVCELIDSSHMEAGSNTSIVALRVVGGDEKGDSKIWSRVQRDSNPKMTALARVSSNCKSQTRLLVRERPTSTNPQLSDSNKNLVVSPRWMLYTKTHWPTDCRT
jgi:hypothetical protein